MYLRIAPSSSLDPGTKFMAGAGAGQPWGPSRAGQPE